MEITEKNIESYINAAIKHGECTEEGDYKQANKQYKIIQRSLNELKVSEKGVTQLKDLMEHQSDYVKLWSSTHLLSVEEKKSRQVLMELARKPGFLGLTAQTTLDEWTKGNLKLDI